MKHKTSLIISLLLGFGVTLMECGKPWVVTYNEETNEYVGIKEKCHEQDGEFNYVIQVSEKNNTYAGSFHDEYADGIARAVRFSEERSKRYFDKFKKLYNKKS